MKTFFIDKKEFNLATKWEELTLRQYLNLTKIKEKEKEYLVPTLYMVAIFETLCGVKEGDLDNLELQTLSLLTADLEFVSKTPVFNKLDHINIEGVDYVFNNELNTIKLNEIITIQSIQKQFQGGDFIPYLLAVLLRPGKQVFDQELKKDVWIQDRFDSKNYEYRVNLFLDKCKGVDLMGAADFFLTGSYPSKSNLNGSMKAHPKTSA